MGSSKVTTGYNYKLAWLDMLCKGPLDAFLEFRGADKQAWRGRLTTSGAIIINKPELWGGDKDQGGAVGTLRVQFGEAGQMPNAYLSSVIGPKIGAWRGIATVAYEGGTWGANNPYAQKRSYRGERIKKGWDNDDCWYPATAAVPLDDLTTTTMINPDVVLDCMTSSLDGSGGGFDFTVPPFSTIIIKLGPSSPAWSYTPSDDYQPENYHGLTWWNHFGIAGPSSGNFWPEKFATAAEAQAAHAGEEVLIPAPAGGDFRLYLRDALVDDNRGEGSYSVAYSQAGSRYGENPAHTILYSHTQHWAGRQPRETVNLDNLTAAADWFYTQGFGLCSTRVPKEESPREYIRRIEKVAGCSFTQSLDDGLYYLDIANGEYDLGSLPVITDDDVLSFKETKTVMDDAVNSVSVKYFDPERKESVITPPTRAMGLIAQFGEIHQTYEYPEIPIKGIALRVALRELLSSITPTSGFELDVMPTVYKLRKNQYVRLQLPKRGIADMVCLVAEIPTAGKLKSGAFKLKLVQDIYSLPDTVYTEIELGEDTSPPSEAEPIEYQVAFEAPYLDLAANMSAADLAALPEDAGYLVGAAVDPGRMRDFTMAVASDGGGYENVAVGEFCPSCTSTGEVQPGLKVGIGFGNSSQMASVEVGDVGLWDDELVRVDAVDLELNTLDLGRGCGDTLPQLHLAGSRIFFYQRAAAYDPTQRIAGESLDVKLLTNAWTDQLDPADAAAMNVEMAERWIRPYPPGDIRVDDMSFFDVGAATPGEGGGEGGGPTSPPVTSPNGSPSSSTLGPNGGYKDDAPPLFPPPDVFDTDLIDDGGFDSPTSLAGWRQRDGSPLGPEWDIVDGKLHFRGAFGIHTAYYFGARYSLPWMPFPRITTHSTADVMNDPNVQTRIGVAWGLWQVSNLPSYLEASEAASYPAETSIAHDFTHTVTDAGVGPGFPGQYSVLNFMPVVQHIVGGVAPGNAWVDNVTMEVSRETLAPVTTESPANLDLASGLAGWELFPDPSDTNPYVADVSVAGGVMTFAFVHEYGPFRWAINLDPLEFADTEGKYVRMGGLVLCNDNHVQATNAGTYTSGGVTFGLAHKLLDGSWTLRPGGRMERGDMTLREVIQRVLLDAASGITVHMAICATGEPGTMCQVSGLFCESTVDVKD